MKPFSPIYYVKENKTKCILLIFMLFLSYAVYLGGLYATNVRDNWNYMIDNQEQCVAIYSQNADTEGEALKAFARQVEKEGRAEVIWLGKYNGLHWESIMGFESGTAACTFCSVTDFKKYCEFLGINCAFDKLKSGSFVLSDRFAKNLDLKLGDKIDPDYDGNIYGEYTLDALTEEEGYCQYYIDESNKNSGGLMLIGKEKDGETIRGQALLDYAKQLQQQFDVLIGESAAKRLDKQLNPLHTIYIFLVFLIAVIMAVTINAAFIGMYQKREYEFAVYRAIGISKPAMAGKIAGELLVMDMIALVLGAGVSMLFLYLYNNFVLYPVGKYLRYFHPIALLGLLVCNVTVVVPLMVTRCKSLTRADICDY
ncbi:MAG: ABC transporter permease [Lachnospiraceae bacterium]|nr:ABC transporter permease [Lachnospiraceae bacterium]